MASQPKLHLVEQVAQFTQPDGTEVIHINSDVAGEMMWTLDQLTTAIQSRIVALANSAASSAVASAPIPVVGDVLQVAVPNSGDTVVCGATTTVLAVNNAALLLALGVTLPSNPRDAQRITICAASAVTALTMTADKPIKGALTSLALNSFARFIYSAVAGGWFRIG